MKYHTLIRKVVSLQRSKRLIPQGARLLIAFSGGVDSVALTLSLMELKDFLQWQRLALAHINHGIRGEETQRDEAFCIDFAKRKGLEIFVRRLRMDTARGNLEARARELRYKALEEILQKEGFHLTATAHHLNDLVETIILWLVRGSGREGLLGFEEREGSIIRPLYLVKRQEIENYVRLKGEAWVEDSTNYNLSIPRNLIRHKVIPELKSINPNLEESILRLREILKEEEQILNSITEESLKGGLDRKAFLKLPRAIQRRLVHKVYGLRNFKEIEGAIRSIKRGSHLKLEEGPESLSQ
ncbi:MAG: tRNA lysidine(34) synthetase TilS [Aquificaceae bacterium]